MKGKGIYGIINTLYVIKLIDFALISEWNTGAMFALMIA